MASFSLSFYSVSNILLLLSWFPVRFFALSGASAVKKNEISHWERHAFLATLATIFYKIRQSPDYQTAFSRCSLYAQMSVLVLALKLDQGILTWYIVIFALHFILVPPNIFSGPGKVVSLTQRALLEILTGRNQQHCWLIYLFSNPSNTSLLYYKGFVDLSLKYSSSDLSFARIDVGRWSEIAEGLDLDMGMISSVLPVLLLVKNGKVVSQMSMVTRNGFTFSNTITKEDVVKDFGLDFLLLKNRKNLLRSTT